MRFKYKVLLIVSTVSLILDQWTKHIVHTTFRLGESRPVIDPIWHWTYVRNKGAAFSFLDGAPDKFREPFFFVVPIIALTAIVFFFRKLKDDEKLTIYSLSLITGGAIGNVIDRMRFGYVIDFVDWHWKEVYHWPRFNVADSCIVVGVCLMFVHSLFLTKKEIAAE
jgi:signal peptidase II